MTEDDGATPGRGRRHLRTVRTWLVVTVAGAIIAAVVGYYVPKILDRAGPAAAAQNLGPTAAPGPPILVNVNDNPVSVGAFGGNFFSFVLPSAPKPDTVPPDGCEQLLNWGHQHGGVDFKSTRLRVVVQGASDQGVLIEHLRAKPSHRDNPAVAAGIAIGCGGSQGEVTPRDVVIDLDSTDLEAHYENASAGRRPLFGFTLAKSETEVFDITASATTSTVEWLIELDLVVGGKSMSVEVADAGKPFVTTAWQSPRSYGLIASGWTECLGNNCRPIDSAKEITY